MLVVVAIGGNALLERAEKPDAEIQLRHIRQAAPGLVALAEQHDVVLCHGNGPQVGMLALESEADASLSHPYGLDVLGAQTQGMIGYWLSMSLRNAGLLRPVVTILTQVEVDPSDPAFRRPVKFVGPTYPEYPTELVRRHGWVVTADSSGWRRVVPSPEPKRIIERAAITGLLGAGGAVVICGGGGGIPVATGPDGRTTGVDAVIDKDLTASLLAVDIGADRLVLLTDVAAVQEHFGTPGATALREVTMTQLSSMHFPAGSMGPKVEACRRFVSATGRLASIGGLSDAAAVLAGDAGTVFRP